MIVHVATHVTPFVDSRIFRDNENGQRAAAKFALELKRSVVSVSKKHGRIVVKFHTDMHGKPQKIGVWS